MSCNNNQDPWLGRVLLLTLLSLGMASPATGQSVRNPGVVDGNLIRIAEAEGTGSSEQEALQAAFDNAVKKAVGFYVETKSTISSADESFVREVATLSNGYIAWYEKTSFSNLRDGTKRVLITAEVSRERLEQRLTDQRIWTRTEEAKSAPVGGRNLNAKILSELKRDTDAAKLLITWLSKSPTNADCFLGVEIADVPDDPMEVAKFPKVEGREHRKEYEYCVFFIITGAEFKPTGKVRLKIACWILSEGMYKVLQHDLPGILLPDGPTYAIGGFAVDAKGKAVSQTKIPLDVSEGLPIERIKENCWMYGPFLGVYRGPSDDRFYFSIPYKYVSRLGCSLEEMTVIQDVETSLLEITKNQKDRSTHASEPKRIGNRTEKVPADFDAFLKNFDAESSAKALIRTETSLAPNRRSDRSGVTQAWATLLARESSGLQPLKGQTIQVYVQSGNDPAQNFGTYTTDAEGKIRFTEPPGRQLSRGTKLLFKYNGDDRYRDASAEMLIR